MKYLKAFLVLWLILPAAALPQSTASIEADIQTILKPFEKMGKKDFETKWPEGQTKEKYTVAKDGTVSYTKFFPAGNYATRHQKTPTGAITYEKWYGNGKESTLLKQDERTVDYTTYWPSGLKKVKFQRNRLTKEKFFTANDETGKQVHPKQ